MGYRPGTHLRLPIRGLPATQVSHWVDFSPLSLNPDLWLDASDTTSITESSGAVSQWNDKSGNLRHMTQATSANQPITNSRTVNNLNVLDFQGNVSAHFMTAGDVLDLGTNGITIFSVVQFDAMTSVINRTLIGKYKISPAAGSWLQIFEIGNIEMLYRDATTTRNANAAITNTTSILWTSVVDRVAGLVSNFVDEKPFGSVTFTPDSNSSRDIATAVYLGGLRNSADSGMQAGFYFDGTVCEIIVCVRTLTQGEINVTSSYLNRKWGLIP